MARVTPPLEVSADGGQVVVTRFECPSLMALIAVRLIHSRLKPAIRRETEGFLGVATVTDWRSRTMLSVSLWRDLECIYSMGKVTRHVTASRVPARLGVTTACGIFCLAGDWRRVMFGGEAPTRSPLRPLGLSAPPDSPLHPPRIAEHTCADTGADVPLRT